MSATGYLDACGFIPASSGTGDFVVSTNVTGYQTPASAGAVNATVYTYRAESADKSEWEIGFGTYAVSGTTLARTTILASSTGSKVSFSAAPNVYVTAAKADLQNASLLNSGNLDPARLSATTTAHGVALFEGAGAQLGNTGAGTVGQALISGGAGADPSFQSGARVLLNTLTAANSATLSDTTSITSAFTEYEIVFENIVPATNNTTFELQIHSGGAFQTTTYLATIISTSSSSAISNPTTFIQLSGTGLVQNSGAGLSGRFTIYNPSGTTAPKMVNGTSSHASSASLMMANNCGGYWNGGNGAVDGFRALMSAGNITSGTIKIYGLT